MSSSLLYEVHTRRWLRSLSEAEGRVVSLDTIPRSAFERWHELGVTHLWLMGVWTTGPKGRKAFLQLPDTEARIRSLLPNWKAEDVSASPYAIRSYTVAPEFGGDRGLAQFRRTLHHFGINLILDFVPNHVGLDHPWLATNPSRFVSSPEPQAGFFRNDLPHRSQWVAHGKDPYFPPWIDTAQLDLRLDETQEALVEDLRAIADSCDGVRCDMAMLALRDVFESSWRRFSPQGQTAASEFWIRAIEQVGRPGFLFIAEAYWDLEPRLLEMGFNYVYDKRVTDHLIHRHWSELESHLASTDTTRLSRGVHFLENHDEPRIACLLDFKQHELAAFLITVLPGMCMIFDGQLDGARLHSPVQLAQSPSELENPSITAMYRDLFDLWKSANVAGGLQTMLSTSPVVVVRCESPTADSVIALVNGRNSQEEVRLPAAALATGPEMTIRSLRQDHREHVAWTELQDGEVIFAIPPESFDLLAVNSHR